MRYLLSILLLCVLALAQTPSHSNSLSWSASVQPSGVVVSSYAVYKSSTSGKYVIGTPFAKVTATSYVDIGPLKAGEVNFYAVSVLCATCTGSKESPISPEIKAQTPADPTSPVAVQGPSFVVVSR